MADEKNVKHLACNPSKNVIYCKPTGPLTKLYETYINATAKQAQQLSIQSGIKFISDL